MKNINAVLIVVALSFSLNSIAQIHTFPWNPSSITPEQKDYIDIFQQDYYDTLGNKLSQSSLFASRQVWLEGNYLEYVEVDSSSQIISWKRRKATDDFKNHAVRPPNVLF